MERIKMKSKSLAQRLRRSLFAWYDNPIWRYRYYRALYWIAIIQVVFLVLLLLVVKF